MLRVSRVLEQPDTKSVVDLKSASSTHANTIFVKLGPFGRSNNRRVIGVIPPPPQYKWRDPVNLGEVNGGVHPSTPFQYLKTNNVKSSRRGYEHRRLRTSESWTWVNCRQSDLTLGDNPWNGTREIK